MDFRICQTTASPAEPGGLPLTLGVVSVYPKGLTTKLRPVRAAQVLVEVRTRGPLSLSVRWLTSVGCLRHAVAPLRTTR